MTTRTGHACVKVVVDNTADEGLLSERGVSPSIEIAGRRSSQSDRGRSRLVAVLGPLIPLKAAS